MRFSSRSHLDRRKNPLAAALSLRAASGRTHLDLTVSNPTRAGVPYDRNAIRAAIASDEALVYDPEPFGQPGARRSIAALWASRGVEVDASRIVLTASTSEAYSFSFKLLCDPGDAVLVPRPSYPLFEHLAKFEGVEVAFYDLSYDGAWHVDFDSLHRAMTPRTRAVAVVSPNNPTGSYLGRDELGRLAELGIPIISDEVFAEYSASGDPRRAVSALETDRTLVLALDGLSKLAALPQMKLAWITVGGPERQVSEALARLELVSDAFLSPSAVVQHALPALLVASAPARDFIKARVVRNHAALVGATASTTLTPLRYEGGWYAVLRLPGVRTEDEWVLGLLEERDVLVQPGYFYDFSTEPFAVVSLLTEPRCFDQGIARFVEHAAKD